MFVYFPISLDSDGKNLRICSICDLRHLTKPSTSWCSECDQALCDECKEYHSLSRGTQNHETIGIDDYQSLSQSVTVYSSHCSTHNDKYQMYCQTHDTPLCLFCVEKHIECKDVIHLSKKTKDIKTSDTWKDTEQSLIDIDENIDIMETKVKQNIEEIGEQKGSILTNISRVRQEISNHLDKLEESFRNEVTKIEDQSTRNIKDTLQMLDEKKTERLKYQQQLQDMKMYASDLQTYLGLHQISSDIVKLESSLQSVIEKGSLDKVSLTCSINESLNDIARSIKTFGTIAETKVPTSITYIRQKDKQAQIIGVNPKSIDDIKMKLIQKFDINSKEISAFDVACIDNNTVAVTSGVSSQGINIIDINSKTIIQNIIAKSLCHGITHTNGFLFCCVEKHGIYRINLKDTNVKCIVECDISLWSYISSFNGKLYYCDKDKNTVTCCDIDGKLTWKFKNKSILVKPGGLTVDNNGYIYIVSRDHNSVVVLSPDGQQSRTHLSENSELNKPHALTFDKDRNKMLIANEGKTAFLFDIYR
ncbi:unnamed protein product [Mytilus edulis]|uniref:B box-type domain-containing protein n=1 Tax=Mytilus edulis TaxID=6550 RepID=A0A8S3QVU2_MYTED|nr:unnamed protein product [Mytilus edulis]